MDDNGVVSAARRRAGGKWWSKSRGLDRDVFDSFASSLSAQPGRPARVLAWGRTPTGVCIGSPSALSFDQDGSWTHVGWHHIEKGGWNADTDTLRWAEYGGRRGFVVLTEPGMLPQLFRERVSASIVLEQFVPVQAGRGVIISARRDLSTTSAVIEWHASLGRGMTWDTPGVQEVADEALAQLKAEYDIR